jgi:hypothetical protein
MVVLDFRVVFVCLKQLNILNWLPFDQKIQYSNPKE